MMFGTTFIALLLLASTSAQIVAYNNPYAYLLHSSYLSTPQQQQYHTRDILGQYAYGYSEPLSSKQESRSLDGVTRGSYSYRDATGKLQQVDYTADDSGFHVSGTNLVPQQQQLFRAPVAVSDTMEVAAARRAHLAAHEEARLRLANFNTDSYKSNADNAGTGSMELHNAVNTNAIVENTKGIDKPQAIARDPHAVIRSKVAYLPFYSPSTLNPNIYSFKYPFSSHIIPTNSYI